MKAFSRTSIPLLVLMGLALLAIPRVVVHDLKLLPLDSLPYIALAVGPLLVWLGVAALWQTSRPWRDFLVLGLGFGILLGLTHQILWEVSWGDNMPHIGGNMAGKLSPGVEELVLRAFAFGSSLMTGLVFGAPFGLVALVASRLRRSTK